MKQNKPGLAGDQLRLARLARGLNFEQLGERVGVTRQYIQQLETGAKAASSDMIAALAEALGVTPRFISSPRALSVSAEECHFRKQASAPLSVTNQVLARATILDRMAEELDARLDLPRVNFPHFAVSSLEDAEIAATLARQHWGLGESGPITSMMRVAENAGAIVTNFGDLSERVDAFSMARRRPVIVRSLAKESLCRQRFDLAHEVGHLVMHPGVHTGDKTTEDQAHRFASAFLLPRTAMVREFPRGARINWAALRGLKLRWKVSLRGLIRRGYDLNMLTAAQYRIGNITLMKEGQSKKEVYDDELPLEQPELLQAALTGMSGVDVLGERAVAESLGLADPMYELITGRSLPPPLFGGADGKLIDIRAYRS